jgi:hypothetical protein
MPGTSRMRQPLFATTARKTPAPVENPLTFLGLKTLICMAW